MRERTCMRGMEGEGRGEIERGTGLMELRVWWEPGTEVEISHNV